MSKPNLHANDRTTPIEYDAGSNALSTKTASSSTSTAGATEPAGLPSGLYSGVGMDELGKANRRSQIDGVTAGVAAGFLAGQLSARVFKQGRNASLLSGLVAGVGAGYVIAQESLRLQLVKAQAANADLRTRLSKQAGAEDQKTPWDSNVEVSETQGESLLQDRYATTRGDH